MSNPEGGFRTRKTGNLGETIQKLKRQVEKLEGRVAILEGHRCKCGNKDEVEGSLLDRIFSK